MGAVSYTGNVGNSNSSGSGSSGASGAGGSNQQQQNQILKEQEAQFTQNFILETKEAMIDNQSQTNNAIATSHSQSASASQAAERETGESNAHIVA